MEVFVTGLFSGPNPSPGVGVARSLRDAYPEARIVGVDYSTRSTGLHLDVFDDLWIQRPWDELDLRNYAEAIAQRLGSGAFWLSGMDIESEWLAATVGPHPRLLGPPSTAIEAVSKSSDDFAGHLALASPPTMSGLASDYEIHGFCREHGWRVWLKGPRYQAVKVSSWPELVQAREVMTATWGTAEIHLQAHLAGSEESIVFAAWRGELLAAAHMAKRVTTEEGKTWAGAVESPLSAAPEVAERLGAAVERIGWTGGAEIEMLRDRSGRLHFIECNPRFPAWIHGATLAGLNLPAELLAAAGGSTPLRRERGSGEFARVVLEVPVRTSHPLPSPVVSAAEWGTPGKHPSGMPKLASMLEKRRKSAPRRSGPDLAHAESLELGSLMRERLCTPVPLFLDGWAERAFAQTAKQVAAARRPDGPDVQAAYSIKTNPDARLLDLALRHGMLAETISTDEVAYARGRGFDSAAIVRNGPGKHWPTATDEIEALAVFADSPIELIRLARGGSNSRYVGPRLRIPSVESRFGSDLGHFSEFAGIVAAIDQLPADTAIGVHFHYASSDLGWSVWRRAVMATLEWAFALEASCGREIRCLDLGGGWDPVDWNGVLLPTLGELAVEARQRLQALELLIVEPGKALVQPAFVIATEVLEARSDELVVDASIAELPEARAYPHRVMWDHKDGRGWRTLGPGDGRVLGRLCMESDVLASDLCVGDVRPGDRIAIADAGAYDRSMSYGFGRG